MVASTGDSAAHLAPLFNDPRQTVLIADDDAAIRRVLQAQLAARGYSIYEARTGAGVLQAVPMLRPDVVLLDLGLPDLDGIEVTRRLRETSDVSIIILSVRAAESDKIAALDAGADDYLTKPCYTPDLLERLRAAHFRATFDGPIFSDGDLTVDLDQRIALIEGQTVELTAAEYDLLQVFVLNLGRLLTESRLAREVWGQRSRPDGPLLLRTTVRTLREKLHPDPARPRHIVMEPGVGYRLRTGT